MSIKRFQPVRTTEYSLPSLGSSNISRYSSGLQPYSVSYTKNNTDIESDEKGVMTGPSATTSGSGGVTDTPEYGFISSTGTGIKVDNVNGGEVVEISHFTGAKFVIDSDGSIHLMPTGQKGFGLHAARGRGLIYAHGDLVLESESGVFIESGGNLEINVKNDLLMNVGGNYISTIEGNTQEIIKGTKVEEIVGDHSFMVAGQDRKTVAGDMRTQVSGTMRYDIGGEWDQRVEEKITISGQDNISVQSTNIFDLFSSTSSVTVTAQEELILQSHETARIIGESNVTIDGKKGIYNRAGNEFLISSKGNVDIDTSDNFNTRATNVLVSAEGTTTILSENANIDATDTMDIRASSIMLSGSDTINARGGTIDLNDGTAPSSPLTPVASNTTEPRSASEVDEPEAPDYPESNTIIDTVTTRREAPDFPYNAVGGSKRSLGMYENEDNTIPGRIRQEANQNQGVSDYGQFTDSGRETVGADQRAPEDNTSIATRNPLNTPSMSNSSAKLSKHVTVGNYFYNYRRVPRQHILNAMNLCHNIVDPIIDEFNKRGVNILVAPVRGAGYRPGTRSRHSTGSAIDLQPANVRDYQAGFDIAEFCFNNLPWTAIYFEISTGGNALIHFESARPGQGAGGNVWTCKTNRCSRGQRVDGLDFSQYTEYLRQRGLIRR